MKLETKMMIYNSFQRKGRRDEREVEGREGEGEGGGKRGRELGSYNPF